MKYIYSYFELTLTMNFEALVKQTVYEKTISISYTCDLFDWVYHEFMLLHSNIWNFLFNAVYECNITFSCSNIAYI